MTMTHMTSKWIITGATLLSTLSIHAQSFEKIAPKELPNISPDAELPSAAELPTDETDRTQILPSLTGVVIHRNKSDVNLTASVPVGDKVTLPNDAEGVELFQSAALRKMLAQYVGKPVSMQSLGEMKRKLVMYFRNNDRPAVDVILPEQDVSNGVVQLIVIESLFGKAGVAGNKHFSDKTILNKLTIPEGQSISAQALLDDVDWMNTNPFLNVQPIFSPSEAAYSSDIILKVNDQRPWRYYLGYENSGNTLTGEDQYIAGFNWGDAFGLGHLLNYQFTMAADAGELSAHAFSYSVPFANKSKLDFYGGFTQTEAENEPFTIEGDSRELGTRYTIGLNPYQNITQKLYAGVGWKSTQNALEFGVIPVSDNEVQRGQVELGYQMMHRIEGSKFSADVALVSGFGGIFSNSSDDDFNSNRSGADNSYSYLKFNVNWLKQLPCEMIFDTQIIGQWSADKLLSSEQLTAGGYNSVRGYNEREFSQADSGIIWRNELKFKSMNYGFNEGHKAEWQPFIFTDYAVVTAKGDEIVRQDGSAADTGIMWSAGVGVNATVSKHMTLRAEYGWQLRDAGSDDEGRFHIGTVISF
ncbi:MAG: ShlB/FhaC/HecB family hemolysin secretion/activation protein [Bacteroidota bacterium]